MDRKCFLLANVHKLVLMALFLVTKVSHPKIMG